VRKGYDVEMCSDGLEEIFRCGQTSLGFEGRRCTRLSVDCVASFRGGKGEG
jgi:hypothetical protein